jgi:hypothetical protein
MVALLGCLGVDGWACNSDPLPLSKMMAHKMGPTLNRTCCETLQRLPAWPVIRDGRSIERWRATREYR